MLFSLYVPELYMYFICQCTFISQNIMTELRSSLGLGVLMAVALSYKTFDVILFGGYTCLPLDSSSICSALFTR